MIDRNELARSTFAGNNRGLFEFVSEQRDARDCDGLLSMSWNMGDFIAAVEALDDSTIEELECVGAIG